MVHGPCGNMKFALLKWYELQINNDKYIIKISEGSFTVFAPVDKAFEAVPDLEAVLEDTEALSAILLR